MNNIIVTELPKNLRALGRSAMATNRQLCMLAILVYGIAAMLPPVIITILFKGTLGANMASIYSLLISGPFTLGLSILFLAVFRRQHAELSQVFYGFENFGKSLGLFLFMSLFILLWSLLFVIPGIIAAIRYSQAFYVLADHPEYGIQDCMNESKRMMYGNKWKYFVTMFSFIGWIILCSIPMGIVENYIVAKPDSAGLQLLAVVAYIPFIWLTPYMTLTAVGFYEILAGNLRVAPYYVDAPPQPIAEPAQKTVAEEPEKPVVETPEKPDEVKRTPDQEGITEE